MRSQRSEGYFADVHFFNDTSLIGSLEMDNSAHLRYRIYNLRQTVASHQIKTDVRTLPELQYRVTTYRDIYSPATPTIPVDYCDRVARSAFYNPLFRIILGHIRAFPRI